MFAAAFCRSEPRNFVAPGWAMVRPGKVRDSVKVLGAAGLGRTPGFPSGCWTAKSRQNCCQNTTHFNNLLRNGQSA
jgi:hypothetical protein